MNYINRIRYQQDAIEAFKGFKKVEPHYAKPKEVC